jgi:Xaa-Pro aminopeptidase
MRLDLCQNDIAALRGGLPLMEVEDISTALWRLRSIKSEREIEKLRKAAKITLQGYGTGFDAMREGMTEKELAAVIGAKWLELGASSTGSLFLAAGWRSVRYAHVDPVDVPVRRGRLSISTADAPSMGTARTCSGWPASGNRRTRRKSG